MTQLFAGGRPGLETSTSRPHFQEVYKDASRDGVHAAG